MRRREGGEVANEFADGRTAGRQPCLRGKSCARKADRDMHAVMSQRPLTSHEEEGSGKRSRKPFFLYIAIHNHDLYKEGRKRMYERSYTRGDNKPSYSAVGVEE